MSQMPLTLEGAHINIGDRVEHSGQHLRHVSPVHSRSVPWRQP